MDCHRGDPKTIQYHDRVRSEVLGGFSCKDEIVGVYLDGPEHFGTVVIVCKGGVDGDTNVDELGDFCYIERGC